MTSLRYVALLALALGASAFTAGGSKHLINKGVSGCNSKSKCALCTGDCDRNSDCAKGLACFQRSGKTPIKGCAQGGTGDVANYDYCVPPGMKVKHTNCRTSGGNAKGRPCVFPFMYKGKRFSKCTKVDNGNTAWCATSTAMAGMEPSLWGNCPRKGCATKKLRVNSVCYSRARRVNRYRDCPKGTKCGLKPGSRRGFQATYTCNAPTTSWSRMSTKYCSRRTGSAYRTLKQAEAACAANPSRCIGVYDSSCDGKGAFYMCPKSAKMLTSRAGSCVYVKPTSMNNKGISGCNPKRKCQVCQGDCDTDADCVSGLKCFQRNNKKSVPGCSTGGTGDKSAYDYCYNPSSTAQSDKLKGCTSTRKCRRCQGDCDSDSDCQRGLKCYQRNSFQHVPGCSRRITQRGNKRSVDFCYRPRTSCRTRFRVSAVKRNFKASIAYCKSVGMVIASIHNAKENAQVRKMVKTVSYLGATETRTNGRYRWLDGSKFTYTNPSNDGLKSSENKLAITPAPVKPQWHDWGTGTSKLGVVCRTACHVIHHNHNHTAKCKDNNKGLGRVVRGANCNAARRLGYCKTQKAMVHRYCKRTCHLCPKKHKKCRDKSKHCRQYKSQCRSHKIVAQTCCKTCKGVKATKRPTSPRVCMTTMMKPVRECMHDISHSRDKTCCKEAETRRFAKMCRYGRTRGYYNNLRRQCGKALAGH